MKSKKGQALVEFIIIAPIFIMMIMSVIDLGNVIYKKYQPLFMFCNVILAV